MGTSAAAGPADLSGTLDGFDIAELFELFTTTSASGALIFGEPVGATLWIDAGDIVYGTSPGTPGPRDLLARRGVVAPEDFDDAAGEGSTTASLVDRYGIDADALAAVAREEIITTAFEIVAVGAEDFEFRSGAVDPLGVAVRLDHASVFEAAEERRDEWRRIAERVPSTGIVAALSPRLPADSDVATISATEWSVLSQLDARRSVADVIGILGKSAFEVCDTLFDLLDRGVVEIVDAPDDHATN